VDATRRAVGTDRPHTPTYDGRGWPAITLTDVIGCLPAGRYLCWRTVPVGLFPVHYCATYQPPLFIPLPDEPHLVVGTLVVATRRLQPPQ